MARAIDSKSNRAVRDSLPTRLFCLLIGLSPVDDPAIQRLVELELCEPRKRWPEPFPNPRDDILRRRVVNELVQVVVIDLVQSLLADGFLNRAEIRRHTGLGVHLTFNEDD